MEETLPARDPASRGNTTPPDLISSKWKLWDRRAQTIQRGRTETPGESDGCKTRTFFEKLIKTYRSVSTTKDQIDHRWNWLCDDVDRPPPLSVQPSRGPLQPEEPRPHRRGRGLRGLSVTSRGPPAHDVASQPQTTGCPAPPQTPGVPHPPCCRACRCTAGAAGGAGGQDHIPPLLLLLVSAIMGLIYLLFLIGLDDRKLIIDKLSHLSW